MTPSWDAVHETFSMINVTEDGSHYSVVDTLSSLGYAEKPPALCLEGDRTGMAASEEQLRLAAEVRLRNLPNKPIPCL